MKIYDISVDLRQGMHAFPGDPRFRSRKLKELQSDSYDLHKITMGNHSGTHVDAPAHFVAGGAPIDAVPLELLSGRARVLQIHDKEKIDAKQLQQLLAPDDFRILFKTRNSMLWSRRKKFSRKYVYLTLDGAKYLVERGIKCVGTDYLSIEQYGSADFPVHKELLANGVALIEGLNLSEVEEGYYNLTCLPLRLSGLDAAPARAILHAE